MIARHHEKIHTGEKPFACNICNFKSTRSSSLTKHVKSHGITNDLSSTQEAVKPKIHEKEVRNNVPIDCNNGVDKESNQLGDQILNSSKYEKSKCQKAILEQLSSLEPVSLEKPNELNRKSINSPEKMAMLPDQTNTPIDTNIGKKYGCKYCDKKFTHAGSAKTHERIHTGEKPYGCSYCEKKFTTSTTAKTHERIHTGEKPYGCSYCEKKFTRSTIAKAHVRTHTGEKPYGCKYCDKNFATLQSSKSHERSHTGEKPYACKYCDNKYATLHGLKAHEIIHIGKKYFCCKNCDFKAATQTSLKKHESTHDQGNIDYISMHGLSNSVLERSNPYLI